MYRDRYGDEVGKGRFKYDDNERMQYKLSSMSNNASLSVGLQILTLCVLIVIMIKV